MPPVARRVAGVHIERGAHRALLPQGIAHCAGIAPSRLAPQAHAFRTRHGDLGRFVSAIVKGWQFSMASGRPPPVVKLVAAIAAIAAIPANAWTRLEDYPDTGEAQIAETTLSGRRLVVRRVRLVAAPGELFAREWRLFPFPTNRTEPIEFVEAEHRQRAPVSDRSL